MSDNIISFKTAKKRAGYAAKEAEAAQNRTKFGRTKAEKASEAIQKTKDQKHLNGHKLDTPSSPSSKSDDE